MLVLIHHSLRALHLRHLQHLQQACGARLGYSASQPPKGGQMTSDQKLTNPASPKPKPKMVVVFVFKGTHHQSFLATQARKNGGEGWRGGL